MGYRELVEWAVFYKVEKEHLQEAQMDAQLIARHNARR